MGHEIIFISLGGPSICFCANDGPCLHSIHTIDLCGVFSDG
jgi:hypothetical protein